MAETPAPRPLGFRLLGWMAGLAALPAIGILGISWWFTAPLETPPASGSVVETAAEAAPAADPVAAEAADGPGEPAVPPWPTHRLEGDPAKRILLEYVRAAERALDAAPGYTATFRKQERVQGVLGPEQTIALKIRHRPFSVYMKFLAPKAGKEVVYVEGQRDNKLIAHKGDWTRRLIPRLVVAPTDPIAMVDNRHPITDAGLLNLARRLVRFRELDLTDPDAVTILDRVTDHQGKTWLRAIHDHPHRNDQRPFKYVEVDFDPETYFPCRIRSHEWPPSDTPDAPPPLAEFYAYDDLDFSATLTDLDFDPANPAYAFTRY